MSNRRGASRRRHRRTWLAALLATLLALLFGLLVTRRTRVLRPRGDPAGESLRRADQPVLAAPVQAAPGRRRLQRLPLLAYLVAASAALVPAGAGVGGLLGSTSPIDPGMFPSIPKIAVGISETPIEAGYRAVVSAAVDRSTKPPVSQPPQEEPPVATTLPPEDVEAESAVESPVYRESGWFSTGTQGIATWYGVIDGFGPEDTMADGSPFNPNDPSIAASNSWPLGTWLMVCHGDRCIRVCVRDRGNFRHALDLSMAAFAQLAPLSSGVIEVTIEVIP